MTIQIVEDSTNLAITLSELKGFLRIDGNDEDDPLKAKIRTAINIFEKLTSRCLIEKEIAQTFDQFPCEELFYLERGTPLVEFGKIEYYNKQNVLTELDEDIYGICETDIPVSVFLNTNKSWPTDIHETRPGAVKVSYTAGYGGNATFIPDQIKIAISKIVGDLYNFREDQIVGTSGQVDVKLNSSALINFYKTNFYEWRSQSRRT